ncbi:heme NO-binding domain-containing protein [Paenibacillus endoradicis]|uniref:heme NO-binding domain-containing protein n=1 Tax=Paenibacillus endoradicis TaxID=2972487 RepID=UPI002159A095|nr:heme NO-binding domain-containing protein [Paenibacillus endoradicis]MCR8656150.1 heme NO-binding domain-containing protein [Paenibacillus endoradicis]
MKGMIFTSFLEMVESKFSLKIVDEIIEASELPSGGSYTTVGTYDHNEMIKLVVELGERTNIPVPDLVRTFGEYLFGQLLEMHAYFLEENNSVFEFLQKVDSYIHVEVRKLYSDAELPAFQYDNSIDGTLIMTYRSSRPFADLAEGLIIGSIAHYGEKIDIKREDLSDDNATRFVLKKME